MRNLFLLATGVLSFISFNVYSTPLTPEEAVSRIEGSWLKNNTRAANNELSLAYTLKGKDDQATVYIFNYEDEGFIISGADDVTYPVLGYSDHGAFDPGNVPPELKFWLEEYSRQIDYQKGKTTLNSSNLVSPSFSDMEAIAPLLKSKWNQGEPYNDDCYTIAADGTQTKSVTGCVATAMAQVMYYFKYPSIGHGEISYTHKDSGVYTMNFGSQAFNWNEMLPTYTKGSYSASEAAAVAYLMKACGYSVKMDYGKGESGANGTNISGALIEYFGYDEGIEVQTRAFRTYNDWASMIYNNLKEVGPVVYDGSAIDGGHSFVCDGYDGNGYFHFNWGWGGMSDGYYLLDALNPDEFGIGGAAGGYNLGQQIILNISPDEAENSTPQLMQFGNVEGKISEGHLSLELTGVEDPGLQYINPITIELTFGVKVINVNDPSVKPQYFESDKKNLEAKQGSYFKWETDGVTLDLSKVEMIEGDEYNFIISTLINKGETTEWSEVVAMPGKYNYVTLVKTASGYDLKNYPVGDINVTDFTIVSSPVYLDLPVKFSAVFTNNSSQQLTRNYSAVFFNSNGEECYKMENYSVNVDGNESTTDVWTSVQWYKESGATDITDDTQFNVKLYDNWKGEFVEGIEERVTVSPTPGEAKVETSMNILNGKQEGDVFVVTGNDLEVSVKVKVLEGFFNHTIMLAIQAPLENGDYYTIMHKHFDAIPSLSAGEEQEWEMTVNFDDAVEGKIYKVEIWGPGEDFDKESLVRFDLNQGGLNTILPDIDGKYRIYDLEGKLRVSGNSLDIMKELPSGIYVINGRKIHL